MLESAWKALRGGGTGLPTRRQRCCSSTRRAVAEALETRCLLAAVDPIISEFMASNTTGLRDIDGDRSDWIELYNPGTVSVNLAGWHLTDDAASPAKWTFPAQTLGAVQYLVVWASGKNRAVAGQQLHSNFSLSKDGEYLALIKPDGVTPTTVFDPFPPQVSDVSYGYPPGQSGTLTLVQSGDPATVLVPTDSSLGSGWTQNGFDDSTWTLGTTGVGYQSAGGTAPLPAETEPNNSTAAANDAAYNFNPVSGNLYELAITGSLGSSDDWFRIGMLDPGDIITLTASGAASRPGLATVSDPYLELVRSNGTVVAYDDNSGPGSESLIYRYTVGTSDTYYIHIKKASSSIATGTYQIAGLLENTATLPLTGGTMTAEVESNNNISGADNFSNCWRAVGWQSHTAGQIAAGDAADFYAFSLTAGSELSIVLKSTSAFNGKVSLLNAAGQAIATEDGTGANSAPNDSFIYSFLLTGSGTRTFYVKVEPAGGSTGTYALDLSYASTTAPPVATSFGPLIGTDLKQTMQGANATAYVRIPFAVTDPAILSELTLRMKYDDGFIAFINGQKVAERNAPAMPTWNSGATALHPDAQAAVFEDIDTPAFRDALVSGENVLAIQGLNINAGDVDFLVLPELNAVSLPLGALSYMATPTPGAANIGGAQGFVQDTHFSVDRGFFTAPFDLAITTDTAGAEIRYTLDGSLPTATTGNVYSGPIAITTTSVVRTAAFRPGYVPTNVDTATYIFLADVIHQSNAPDGYPSSWGFYDAQNTQPATADYEMDPDIVNGAAYADRIIPALESIPTVSIVMPIADLFGNTLPPGINSGIYSFPLQADSDNATNLVWERPASVEYIDPATGSVFQIGAGVQMQGGGSRNPANTPKHSFRLLFKSIYGESKLDFPLFDDTSVDSFDALILKCQYNNTWLHWDAAQRLRASFVQDQWASDTELAMGKVSKHARFVQLYLNGLYWGVYQLQERPESSWAASYFGGDDADYDVLDNTAALIDGSKDAWNTMFNMANAGLVSDAAYQQIQQYLDIPDFIKYMIVNLYDGNQDWDDHNWYAVRRSRVNGVATNVDGFHFLSFDSERTLEDPNANVLSVNNDQRPTRLFHQLIANAEFRQAFADAVHQHLFNGGALAPEVAAARYQAELAKVDPAIIAESARWGDYRRDVKTSGTAYLYTRDEQWLTEANRVLTQYFPVRGYNFLNQLRAAGLYPTIDAPEYSQFGGAVSAGYALSMTNISGYTLYYTTDGTDPRLAGGVVNPGAQIYTGPVTLDADAHVLARVYKAATQAWSALTDASFAVTPLPQLRVTEIMYHPQKPPGSAYTNDDYQFIELQNTGATPLDLEGIRVNGIGTFIFGAGTLEPGARTVLVSNLAAIRSRYGSSVPVAGVYSGQLDHGGETLTLLTPDGRTIEQFTFKDGWYGQTDGEGFSLVAVDPDASDETLSSQEGWRPSTSSGGAPGDPDPGYDNNAVVISEVLPASSNPFIELHNTTSNPIDVSGWFLSNSSDALQAFTIGAGSVISPDGYLAFFQAGSFGTAFVLDGAGGKVYLSAASSPGALGGYRDSVDFGAADSEVSFGRYIKSTGASDFTAQSSPTPGAANAGPLVGPVVINELMYWAPQAQDEYIEIRNTSFATISLNDGINGWKFTSGVGYEFPVAAALSPAEIALVVGIDPAIFRARYGIASSVQIFGPYTGHLSNDGEKVALSRPQYVGTDAPYVLVDRVNYEAGSAWPAAAATGSSLQRINGPAYGNDLANWSPSATGGTPGAPNIRRTAPVISWLPPALTGENTVLSINGSFFDPDAGETWTAQIRWGDSWNWQALTLTPSRTFTATHNYTDSGRFTATVRIVDSSGLSSTLSFPVTVINRAPTAVVTGSATAEGLAGMLTVGSRSDPSPVDYSAGLLYSYDFNNDGVFEVNDSTLAYATIPPAMVDGPSTTMRVRVMDKEYALTDVLVNVTALSLPPVAAFGYGSSVQEGMPGLVIFSNATDASPADMAAGFRYSYDFDNDGTFEIVNSTDPSAVVPAGYMTDGNSFRRVRGRIADKDGAFNDFYVDIPIINIPPVVAPLLPATIGIGDSLALCGSFADPGVEVWTGTVDWGDGSDPQALSVDTERTFAAAHTYLSPGDYAGTVFITDADGGLGSRPFVVHAMGAAIVQTPDDDASTLRLDASGQYIEFFAGTGAMASPAYRVLRSLVSQINITGAPGGTDSLTLDFANGSPLPAGGLAYGDGLQTHALVLTGVPQSASIALDSSQLLYGTMPIPLTAGGSVTLDADRISSLALSSTARLTVPTRPGGLFRSGAITIGDSAALDLESNDLVVDYSGTSPLQALSAYVRNGQIGAGPRIEGESEGEADPTTLGLVDNQLIDQLTWRGQPISDGTSFQQVILKRSYPGDTNLDGRVTQADYINILANMGRCDSWFEGDVNNDGIVSADDMAVVTAHLNEGDDSSVQQLAMAPVVLTDPPAPIAIAPALPEAEAAPAAADTELDPPLPAPEPDLGSTISPLAQKKLDDDPAPSDILSLLTEPRQ